MAGVAVIYTGLAMLMVCCLGGKTFAAILGLLGDALICAAFVAIAVLDRSGSGRRTGAVNTPVGAGQSGTTSAAGTNLGLAAKLNTTSFACAIGGAGLMAIAFLMQLAMWRNHKKEAAYGPGPDNDYTSGRKRGGFFNKKKNNDVEQPFTHEKEAVAVPVIGATAADRHAHRNDMRPSHDTAYTGTTMGLNDNAPTKYEQEVPVPQTANYNQSPASGIVSTSHYTTPGVYDPTYNPETGTSNLNTVRPSNNY
jgi:hypothetical protein